MTKNKRPPVWVGHIVLETSNMEKSAEFMAMIGMRQVAQTERFHVFELRGGTHLVLRHNPDHVPDLAPFDLMVDNLEASHAGFAKMGMKPSAIETKHMIHSSFTLTEPGGNVIKFNSSHVIGTV